jgi:squalene-hopene/tetraprenyl-beta-curcumene cyclase
VDTTQAQPISRRDAIDDFSEQLDHAIDAASEALIATQHADGHWCLGMECDASATAEYVFLKHYLREPLDAPTDQKLCRYLTKAQLPDGGWQLFPGGPVDINVSVKAYLALKLLNQAANAESMRRAQRAIVRSGGAEQCNILTRVVLERFGCMTRHAIPVMPVELMLLPDRAWLSLRRMSYWARCFIVPLLVLQARDSGVSHSRHVSLDELFCTNPQTLRLPARGAHQNLILHVIFRLLDTAYRHFENRLPSGMRERAVQKAVSFVNARLNHAEGYAGFLWATAHAAMMYDALGDAARCRLSRDAVERLLVIRDDVAYCQPGLSPVWDTALAAHALLEAGDVRASDHAERGLRWLLSRQVCDVRGDWADRRAALQPGGWPFQYSNAHYPDLDDTALVVLAMQRSPSREGKTYDAAIERAGAWVNGMQSTTGGWGAFDADNTHAYLQSLPFADHGGMIDPPTADITAHCLSMLAGYRDANPRTLRAARDFLLAQQESTGSWFGRWGVNYIYGTWSALCALNACGVAHDHPSMRRAATWLSARQHEDGGWGESCMSYEDPSRSETLTASTASQTAWALLGLMAAGLVADPVVARGVRYLLMTQCSHGDWHEPQFTGTGNPHLHYFRYGGYCRYFPLWALARYRTLTCSGTSRVEECI